MFKSRKRRRNLSGESNSLKATDPSFISYLTETDLMWSCLKLRLKFQKNMLHGLLLIKARTYREGTPYKKSKKKEKNCRSFIMSVCTV